MKSVQTQKDDVATALARLHYEIDPGMRQVYRLLAPGKKEHNPDEPVKLLEVNEATIPTGIMPLSFPPQPEDGFPFTTVIIELTPAEFAKVKAREWKLPEGWKVGPLLPRTSDNGSPKQK